MRKYIVSIAAAALTMLLLADAFATTPGSNAKAFENCDVALCMNRDGGIDYNIFGEDVRLFESLEMRNLYRGTISKDDEFTGVSGLLLKAEYFCVTKREGTRLAQFNAARPLDWKKLESSVAKCGHRAR